MPCTCAFRPPARALLVGVLVLLMSIAAATARAGQLPTMFAPTGAASGDVFGWSSATAGDVNGDGYADVIAGAWANDTGGTNSGVAYIYFGGPKADDVADVTMYNPQAGGGFGIAVGTAGDVNGDGYADVIVGADYNDAGGDNAGQAFVYFGGPAMDAVADLTLTGEAAGDYFGITVGDGRRRERRRLRRRHRRRLRQRRRRDRRRPGLCLPRERGPGRDGRRDRDRHDVRRSASRWASARRATSTATVTTTSSSARPARPSPMLGTYVGSVRVYYGGASPDAVADLRVTGEAAGDQFGAAVGTAGDVNGDGYADIVVGARLNDAGGTDAGRAYVFLGGASPDTIPDIAFTGRAAGDFLGMEVGGAGDVNDDGYDDVIVGAPLCDAAGADAGQAYVYYGGLRLDAVADATLTAEAAGDRFGFTVGTAGDVDGDGRADVVVGAYQNDTAGSNAGRVYVCYLDPPPAAARPGLALAGAGTMGFFGCAVGTAGDVNGDGHPDVIVGESRNDAGATDAGAAYVHFGGPGADNVADLVMTGTHTNEYLGWAVGTAGDMNGDGYDDFVVGATNGYALGGMVPTGVAYVFFGGPTPDAVADLELSGAANGDQFGYSVGTAGDVNGDGYDDVVVGAPRNDTPGTDGGRAYVFYGGAAPDATVDLTLSGAASGDQFGYSVGTAGDVNGDGYDDVVVGAPVHDVPGSLEVGAVYVYFGGASPNPVADVAMNGQAAGDWLGISVGTAGDMDGDGYDDVVVGAPFNDANGADAGRVYVLRGGLAVDAVPDLAFAGLAAGDEFGNPVAGAGDVNLDGFADVVVGAYRNDAAGTTAGAAYVFYGGVAGDPVADHVLLGHAANDRFGYSVGTAGDFFADGVDDVVVGALYDDAGGTDAGAAYVYDFNRYFVLSPNDGETCTRTATEVVTGSALSPPTCGSPRTAAPRGSRCAEERGRRGVRTPSRCRCRTCSRTSRS